MSHELSGRRLRFFGQRALADGVEQGFVPQQRKQGLATSPLSGEGKL